MIESIKPPPSIFRGGKATTHNEREDKEGEDQLQHTAIAGSNEAADFDKMMRSQILKVRTKNEHKTATLACLFVTD